MFNPVLAQIYSDSRPITAKFHSSLSLDLVKTIFSPVFVQIESKFDAALTHYTQLKRQWEMF